MAMNAELLRQENERLRIQNAQLLSALEEVRAKLAEPEDLIRAIRQGEIDALVVQEHGQEEIYAVQRFDSAYRMVVENGIRTQTPDGLHRWVGINIDVTEREQTKQQLASRRPPCRRPTAARTDSWRRWPMNCETRWPRCETPWNSCTAQTGTAP